MTDKKTAETIINSILDHMLNRHVTELSKLGYLKAKKYGKDHSWNGGQPGKALRLKWELMDEANDKFGSLIQFAIEEARKDGDAR